MNPLVVITGAGSGIGRATALRFAASGATVVVTDIDLDRAHETVSLLPSGQGHAHVLDVTDPEAWEELALLVKNTYGAATVLVNNAGYTTAGKFLDHSPHDWDKMMSVNVLGVVYGGAVFGRQMIEAGQGGSIINVASAAAYMPIPLSTAYCATKAATKMASDCLRAELAAHKIGVTAICPGAINTNFCADAQHISTNVESAEQLRDSSVKLMKVAHSPDTVAKAIVRASRTNPAVRPVTAEAHLSYALSRVSPGALRLAARFAKTDGSLVKFAQKVVS